MKLARGSSWASPLLRLAQVGDGATAEAVEMFVLAPQARTAVPPQWSRHHGLQRPQGSNASGDTLPDGQGGPSEQLFRRCSFGTVVRACGLKIYGKFMPRSVEQRRLSWRAQIRGEAAADESPADLSTISSFCGTAENSARVGMGDLRPRMGRVVSGVRAAGPRRIAMSPCSDRAPWRPRAQKAARRDARHRDSDCTSRHRRCARPHPLMPVEF